MARLLHVLALIAYIFLLVPFLVVQSAAAQTSSTPIVFIPGFAGSYLCEKDGAKTRVWPGKLDHRKVRLELSPGLDPAKDRHEACGVMREAVRLLGIKVSNVYGKFIDHLRRQVAPGVPVLEFSYDWRFSAAHNARQLRARLDRDLPGQTVDIVAHSFGGLVARSFIKDLGGENRVRKLITMGTPHRGSVDVFESLYDGWGVDSVKDRAVNAWMGGVAEFRKTLLSFPGFYDMMPAFAECCWFVEAGGARQQFSAFDPKAWRRLVFFANAFPSDADKAFLDHQLARARAFHDKTLGQPLPAPHESGIRLVATGWLDTITRVEINASSGDKLQFIKRKGDGTVPLLSATMARDTSDPSIVYAPREHMSIFSETNAMEAVSHIIVGGVAAVGGGQVSQRLKTREDRWVELTGIDYRVSPGAAGPGQPMVLTLRLDGDAELVGADLSHIAASFTAGGEGTPIALALKPATGGPAGGALLTAEFKAPAAAGAYVVRVTIPGLQEHEDVFVVVEE
jgi:pimeloyl-ACP methyl ester carboxylesterase